MRYESEHKAIPGNPSTAKSSRTKLNDRSNGIPLRKLTEDDWQSWTHNGYIVIEQAISPQQAKETAAFIWEFEEKSPIDPETWYTHQLLHLHFRAGRGIPCSRIDRTLFFKLPDEGGGFFCLLA